MPARSMIDVITALAQGKPDEILGCPEGRDVDFKRSPYQLDSAKGKWELAKDVAAFANAAGGLIVIGIRARRSDSHTGEVADEVCPVPRAHIDVARYRDAIANGISPTVGEVAMAWHASDASADGIFTVYVPSQPERSKPFVLRRTIEDSGREVQAFAIPKRNEDRTEWMSADQVQTQLAMLGQFASTNVLSTAPVHGHETNLDERVQSLVLELGLTDEPYLALQLTATTPIDLTPVLFGGNGVYEDVCRWSGIRPSGFDLGSRSKPEARGTSIVFGGSSWRARLGAHGELDLVLPVRFEFLCWAMNPRGTEPDLRINAVPLVESVYDFFRLWSALVLRRNSLSSWTTRLRAQRLRAGNVQMHPGWPERYDWFRPRSATTDSYEVTLPASGEPTRDAFDALVRIYALFELGADAIPFSHVGQIVPEEIGREHQ